MSASSEFPKDRPTHFVRPFVGGQPMGRPGPLRKATNRRLTAAPFTAVSEAQHPQRDHGALATASQILNEGAEPERPELVIDQVAGHPTTASLSDLPTPPSALQIQDFTDQPWQKAAEAAAVVFPDVSLIGEDASGDDEHVHAPESENSALNSAEMQVEAAAHQTDAADVSPMVWGSEPEAIEEAQTPASDDYQPSQTIDADAERNVAAEVDFSWGDGSGEEIVEATQSLFEAPPTEAIRIEPVETSEEAPLAAPTAFLNPEVEISSVVSESSQDAVAFSPQSADTEVNDEVSVERAGAVQSLLAPLPGSREDLELGWLDEDSDEGVASDAVAESQSVDAVKGAPTTDDAAIDDRLASTTSELQGDELVASVHEERLSEPSPSLTPATRDLVDDEFQGEVPSEWPEQSYAAKDAAWEGEEAAAADFADAGHTLDGVKVDAAPRASQLPEWAMGGLGASPTMEADADLAAFVAEGELVDRGVKVLEGVARQVRSGEIVLPPGSGATVESVLAAVLAQLLTRAD